MVTLNIHVVPHKSDRGNPPKADWAVKGEGNSRNTAIKSTKEKAIKRARRIAMNQKSELVIHNRDGKIKDSPPRRTAMEMTHFRLRIRNTKLSFQPRIKCGINSSGNPE